MSSTVVDGMDLSDPVVEDRAAVLPQVSEEFRIVPTWKAGVDLPPFPIPWRVSRSPFTQSPWGVSRPTFGGLPASSPNPLLLTSLPLCPSSRLSCSSMPFLQRYGAADVLDANLQLPEQSEAAVPVTLGILGWQSMQPRPNLAPCPARSPPWTPKWCFWSLGPVAGQMFVLPFASPQINIGTQIDGRRGRHA